MTGHAPVFYVIMKELSVFIDESGDFGAYDPKSPYYIIGMVFHDQSKDISENIRHFDDSLRQIGFKPDYIHVGPLIRREYDYRNLSVKERVHILRRLFSFAGSIDFKYVAFVAEKKHFKEEADLISKLARQIGEFIREHYRFFTDYSRVKIYYDNGQHEVNKIIISVFSSQLFNVEFKKAYQKDYRLAQIADLVCTATLTELKMKAKTLSKSERNIFGEDRDIKKKIIKPLERKKFKD